MSVSSIRYKLACAYSELLKSVCASMQSDKSLNILPEEWLNPWLPIRVSLEDSEGSVCVGAQADLSLLMGALVN